MPNGVTLIFGEAYSVTPWTRPTGLHDLPYSPYGCIKENIMERLQKVHGFAANRTYKVKADGHGT